MHPVHCIPGEETAKIGGLVPRHSVPENSGTPPTDGSSICDLDPWASRSEAAPSSADEASASSGGQGIDPFGSEQIPDPADQAKAIEPQESLAKTSRDEPDWLGVAVGKLA